MPLAPPPGKSDPAVFMRLVASSMLDDIRAGQPPHERSVLALTRTLIEYREETLAHPLPEPACGREDDGDLNASLPSPGYARLDRALQSTSLAILPGASRAEFAADVLRMAEAAAAPGPGLARFLEVLVAELRGSERERG